MPIELTCQQCGKIFSVSSSYKKRKYCSDNCREKVYRQRTPWNKGKKGAMPAPWNKGKPMSEELRRKLSMSLKGHIPWNKGKKGLQKSWNKGLKGTHFSPKTEFKKGMVPWNKGTKGLMPTAWIKGHHHSKETLEKIKKTNEIRFAKIKKKHQEEKLKKKAELKQLKKERLEKTVKLKGGTLLSNYTDLYAPVKIKCVDGHTFEKTPEQIRDGAWCPHCTPYIRERICRKFFETIFEKKFPVKKPPWLKNTNGNKMELDGYSKELKLAFEHQGIQHYKKHNFFHNQKTTLVHRKSDDELKKTLSQKHGVTLIEIPYTIQLDNLEQYVIDACKKQGITPPTHSKINYKQFNVYSPGRLKEAIALAKAKEGECLSKVYITARTKMKWRCKEGHEWKSTFDDVKHGYWCKKCGFKIISEKKIKYSIADFQKLAAEKNGECLSTKYIRYNKHLLFKCEKGHQWKTTPASILNGKWCPHCSHCAKLTIEEMQEIARKKGGKCLSLKYVNSHTALRWQCKSGHQWQATPANIKSKKSWCPYCSKHVKLTLEDLQQTAKNKGGECISKEYLGVNKKHRWKCKEGHEWENTPAHIRSGQWCPKCANKKKRKP